MKHKPMRRILAGLLAGMLCLSMTPGAAFAEEAPGADPPSFDRDLLPCFHFQDRILV